MIVNRQSSTITMLYLYAITDKPALPLPAAPGIDHQPLLTVVYQGLAAIVSPFTAGRVEPSEAALWQHETLVEALMAERTVLPVRFGTVLADEAALTAILRTHDAPLRADLERLRGKVELGLRVLWPDDHRAAHAPQPAALPDGGAPLGSGRAYLMARLEQERQVQERRSRAVALADELHSRLEQLIVARVQRLLVTPQMPLTGAYLVEREQVEAFRQTVDALHTDYPQLRFLCTGPWPAYNFVTGGLLDTMTHRSQES